MLDCFLLFLHFLTSLILKLPFGTQGKPRCLKLFYKQEAGDTGVSPREGPTESCSFSLTAVKFRDRKLNGGLQGLGEGEWGHCLMGTDRVSVREGEKVLEMDGGDGCTTL